MLSFFYTTMWISCKYTYIHIPSLLRLRPTPPSHAHWGNHRALEMSSLYYSAASHQLPVLHTVVYICQCYSLNLSHSLLSPTVPISRFSMYVSLLLSWK